MFEDEIEKINRLRGTFEDDGSYEPVCKRAYTVDDIMEILSISRDGAYSLIKKNCFRSIKIGGRIRVPAKSFDEWLNGEENS